MNIEAVYLWENLVYFKKYIFPSLKIKQHFAYAQELNINFIQLLQMNLAPSDLKNIFKVIHHKDFTKKRIFYKSL